MIKQYGAHLTDSKDVWESVWQDMSRTNYEPHSISSLQSIYQELKQLVESKHSSLLTWRLKDDDNAAESLMWELIKEERFVSPVPAPVPAARRASAGRKTAKAAETARTSTGNDREESAEQEKESDVQEEEEGQKATRPYRFFSEEQEDQEEDDEFDTGTTTNLDKQHDSTTSGKKKRKQRLKASDSSSMGMRKVRIHGAVTPQQWIEMKRLHLETVEAETKLMEKKVQLAAIKHR